MSSTVYRYSLTRIVPFPDVIATLALSLVAVESIHGQEKTRLDARYATDQRKLALVIDADTEVGQALNQVFTGFARREFGDSAFRIERIDKHEGTTKEASAA